MAAWAQIVVVLLGLVVLGSTLLDIFVTALHPVAQSIISARFHRAVWYVVEHLSRIFSGRARRRLLSITLPGSVAGLLLFWLLSLLVGFALLYIPGTQPHGGLRSTDGGLAWGDAFYFSGSCLTSIGFGDIVPHAGLFRTTAIAEGICGLLAIGVAVTYVLAVFPVLPLSTVLAITLNEETNGRVDAVPMVRRYLDADSVEALAQRCRELATQLMVLSEAHTTHPVLFYAHPVHAEHSFLRVLIVTQRLIALLRYGMRRSDFPTLVRDPRVVGLEESYIAVLRLLGTSLHLHVQVPDTEEAAKNLASEFDDLLAVLREAKLRGDEPPPGRERRAFVRFRLVTDPYINAYWANSGYPAAELWGDHPPLRGTTAPFADEDDDDDELDDQ